LAAAYPAPQPGRLNIGVLHTALAGGRPPHAPYAPCTPQELAAKGYDYWALGHVHDYELVSQAPMIVFPGNLQGRNIREVGPKGAVLVTVQDDRIIEPPTRIPLDAVRWARADIDMAGLETQDGLHRLLQDRLGQVHSDQAGGRPLMVRVILAGETPLHGELSRRREALREEVRGIAVAISEELWIEKVQLRTSAPGGQARAEGSVLDELAGLLAQGSGDAELAAALQDDLAEFLTKAPPDLAGDDDLLAVVRGGDVAALLADAAAAVDARLSTDAS
jgi:DNA repair exonuclease SbcCD nuclease subunit